jgi:hypothetical protein
VRLPKNARAIANAALSRQFRVPIHSVRPLLQVGADSDYVWELSDTLVLLSRPSGAVFVSETTKATLLGRLRGRRSAAFV